MRLVSCRWVGTAIRFGNGIRQSHDKSAKPALPNGSCRPQHIRNSACLTCLHRKEPERRRESTGRRQGYGIRRKRTSDRRLQRATGQTTLTDSGDSEPVRHRQPPGPLEAAPSPAGSETGVPDYPGRRFGFRKKRGRFGSHRDPRASGASPAQPRSATAGGDGSEASSAVGGSDCEPFDRHLDRVQAFLTSDGTPAHPGVPSTEMNPTAGWAIQVARYRTTVIDCVRISPPCMRLRT